jgi:hypothetical protein
LSEQRIAAWIDNQMAEAPGAPLSKLLQQLARGISFRGYNSMLRAEQKSTAMLILMRARQADLGAKGYTTDFARKVLKATQAIRYYLEPIADGEVADDPRLTDAQRISMTDTIFLEAASKLRDKLLNLSFGAAAEKTVQARKRKRQPRHVGLGAPKLNPMRDGVQGIPPGAKKLEPPLPTLGMVMSIKQIADGLGLTLRRLRSAENRGLYAIKRSSRQSAQLVLDGLAPEIRRTFLRAAD